MKELLVAGLLVLAGCATPGQNTSTIVQPGQRYVAMGSSYAAGAGIGPLVPATPPRCGRTENNYAHLLAARLGLDLVDVSCGGATTAHILGPWNELPPQLDAVTPDTKLVTVTIGGNDLNYVRNLMIATCGKTPGMMPPAGRTCPAPAWPSDSDYVSLEQHLRQIAQEVRRRAPQAKLVFVDYLRIVPDRGGCTSLPLDETQKVAARQTFRRMAEVTASAAAAEGALLLPASELSREHNTCSKIPWSAGHPGKPASWHPTAAGHVAIVDALAGLLGKH